MKNSRNWFWGLFLISSAVLLIASRLGYFAGVSLLSILLTIALAAIIIESAIKLEFFGILVPAALLVIIYAEPLHLEAITPFPVLIAAVLASAGLDMLFKWRKRPKWHPENWNTHEQFHESVENMDDNVIYNKVTFGAETKYIHSDNLQKAHFISSFGSLKVFLEQAKLSPDGTEIYLDCSFGSIVLYVPRAWNVKDKTAVTLGSVKFVNNPIEHTGPVLELTGSVQFGSVEIHYI